jgi:hypothetical protein
MANETSGKLVLSFDIYEGDQYLRREEISAESVTIGRGPAAMLRVDNEALADLHAVININDDGTIQLLDLGGPTGTTVNGEVVNNTNLRNGDQISVGTVRFALAIHDEQALADEEATQLSPSIGAGAEDAADHDTAGGGSVAPRAAAVGAAYTAPQGGELLEKDTGEDVIAFIMRSGGTHEAGFDNTKPKVLEVAQVWGDVVMNIKQYSRGAASVTAGPVGAEFFVPSGVLPTDNYKVFEWAGSQYVCNISDKWSGFADIGEERHDFHDLIQSGKATSVGGGQYQVPVVEGTRVVADTGNFIFFGQLAAPGKVVPTKFSEGMDYPFLGILGFMGFLFGLLTIMMALSPPPPENEMMEIDDRFVDLLLEKPPEEIPQPKKADANPDAGEGAKAKKEEGKVGKQDAKMKTAKGNKVEMQKQQLDKEIAEQAGVLGALRDGGELDSVFGSSAMSTDLAGGIGGLIGASGTQMGSGGLGGRGGGLGGGGSAEGLGGLGTKGRGSGSSGYGSGGGSFGQKSEGGIGAIGGDPIILGALDKSLIDAVIKRHMNQIRYCYQRELTKNPNLGGKITIKFVIAKDGSVSKSDVKSSTMGNKSVEGCIADRFLRFQFPEPKGGGIVIVSYPFIFSPG